LRGDFRVGLGGHAVVEHQGVLPGFISQFFLAPDEGLGVLAFTNGSRNAAAWLTFETQRLLGNLIGTPPSGIRADVPQHPEIWGDLCGWYHPRAQRTDMQAWSTLGAGVQVRVRRGRLTLRTLSPIPALDRGLVLHPDDDTDPYVFRIDCPATESPRPGSFSRDPATATLGVHLDGLPLSAEKQAASANRRVWATRPLGAIDPAADRRGNALRRRRTTPDDRIRT
jgi:hypothetical protein